MEMLYLESEIGIYGTWHRRGQGQRSLNKLNIGVWYNDKGDKDTLKRYA